MAQAEMMQILIPFGVIKLIDWALLQRARMTNTKGWDE